MSGKAQEDCLQRFLRHPELELNDVDRVQEVHGK
jgi:hypothetical protein